jgi:thioredoxin 1
MAKLQVIDFYAEWCGPCKAMGPAIEALALEYNVEGSDIEIKKANVDKEPELSQKYSVRSIPTLIFLKDGEQADKMVGLQTKDSIRNKINEVLEMV